MDDVYLPRCFRTGVDGGCGGDSHHPHCQGDVIRVSKKIELDWWATVSRGFFKLTIYTLPSI